MLKAPSKIMYLDVFKSNSTVHMHPIVTAVTLDQ